MKTSGIWYVLAAGLMISALSIAMIGFTQMTSRVEGMQRVLMPGRAEIMLPAGMSVLYAEQRSIVNGKTYEVSEAFPFRCGLDEKARKYTFVTSTGKVRYSLGDYAGRNAWDVDVVEPGKYTLVCEGDQPFAMAIGQGIGAWIVIAVIGLFPFMGGIAIMVVVFIKRRRQRRDATSQPAAEPPRIPSA